MWAWGQPRTTADLDLVIHLPGPSIRLLSQELARLDILVPPDVIFDLLLQPQGDLPINAIHPYTGYKAELYLLRPGDEFRAESLARRRLVNLGEPLNAVYVHSPADLILNKVYYFSISQQQKHVTDIASILAMSGRLIDWDYFDVWVERLKLRATWQAVKQAADQLLG